MESPSPVPCCLAGFTPEACSKERNTRSCSSLAIPMPVSHTAKYTHGSPPDTRSSRTVRVIFPLSGVNFTALPKRLISTWLMRIRSARNQVCSRLISCTNSIFFAVIWGITSSRMVSSISRISKSKGSSFILPLSILDISRMSLINPSR